MMRPELAHERETEIRVAFPSVFPRRPAPGESDLAHIVQALERYTRELVSATGIPANPVVVRQLTGDSADFNGAWYHMWIDGTRCRLAIQHGAGWPPEL